MDTYKNKVRVAAHRGNSKYYPENTILGFKEALKLNVDQLEIDLHMTKDGEIIMMHDHKVDRTTNGTGLVVEYLLEDLQKLDASSIFAGQMGFNPIPTLREYFELVKDSHIVTNIELKTGVNQYPGIEEKVLELIREFKLEDRIIISSFNHHSVMRMKKLAPELVYGFLADTWILDAGAYTKSYDVPCYHPSVNMMTQEIVDELKANGRVINVWTVNKEEQIRDLYHKGIDCVIGNFPDLTASVLKELEG